MQVKSNTFGKLSKIREGTVFSNELIFVKEFLQNSQRGKSKDVYIDINSEGITFFDNGIGCKNAENIFTLDKSDWETTDEGYGVGFWSCLVLEELKKIVVASKRWMATLDVENMFLNEDLSVKEMKTEDYIKGFYIKLECSSLSDDKILRIKREVHKVAQYLNFDVYVNSQMVKKADIFKDVEGDFVKEIDNRYFKAKLALNENRYGDIELFYDRRYVSEFYAGIYHVSGVIEPKKGKLTLKEPDRTDYVSDYKFNEFREVLYKEIKNMYIDFLKMNNSNELLDKYATAIDNYLTVEEYEKYLLADDSLIIYSSKEETPKKNDDGIKPATKIENEEISYIGMDNFEQVAEGDNINNLVLEDNENIYSGEYNNCSIEKDNFTHDENPVFNVEDYNCNDYKVVQAPINCLNKRKMLTNINKEQSKESYLKKMIKNTKNMVWVSLEDVDRYSEEISLAKYCNLVVYKTKNILYERMMRKYDKLHISDLKDSLIETYETKNMGLKNKKEEAFIKLLIPICKRYGLPINTFSIANISSKTELKINDKVVYKKIEKNSKEKVYTYATCYGKSILFDRNYLKLPKFSIKSGRLGTSELSLLMFVSRTIAHELAHYIYKTVDNTINHYQMEDKLYKEIVEMYAIDNKDVLDLIKSYS